MINLATILHLIRPLFVFDVETTGGNPDTDRIIQIGITRHHPDRAPVSWGTLINPKVPIPPEITEKHHITDAMVEKAPTFKHYAYKMFQQFQNCDYAGYNILFDLRTMRAEFQRLEYKWDWSKTDSRAVCSLRIYQIKHPRDLQAAYKEFVDPAGFEGAHDAKTDVRATEEVLAGQLNRYPDIPRTVPELADYCFPKASDWVDAAGKFIWRHREAHFGFGKYHGLSLRSIVQTDKEYLEWILKKDFHEETKTIVRRALDGQYPTHQ